MQISPSSCDVLLRIFADDISLYEKFMYPIAKRCLQVVQHMKYSEISNILYGYYRIQGNKNTALNLDGLGTIFDAYF